MKNIIKTSPFFLLLLSAPVFLFGQTTDKMLNLKEAVQLSLHNSKTLRMSSAKVEQAISMYEEAKDNQLPDLKVSGAYLYLPTPKLNLKLGSSNKSSNDSSSSSSSFPNVHQAVYGMISASLPLYAGGKISNGIKSAEYLANAAKLDVQSDKEEVIQ
ncbi:MAG TPA: TolC family protein, partial [Arachidicoccus soli]|nr:TolC family protein [Arachidicoccus soli]